MSAVTPINAADPVSKVIYPFTSAGQLDGAIAKGWIPVRANGTAYKVQNFEGGNLLDGAPENVWFGMGWFAGQQELLQPYWQSGQIPIPPAALLNQPVVAMPADVAANFQAYQTAQQDILGIPWWAWAAGVAAYLLL